MGLLIGGLLAAVAMMMYQAVFDFAPDRWWWNPFETFSLATMLLQWALLVVIVYALNRFLANRVRRALAVLISWAVKKARAHEQPPAGAAEP